MWKQIHMWFTLFLMLISFRPYSQSSRVSLASPSLLSSVNVLSLSLIQASKRLSGLNGGSALLSNEKDGNDLLITNNTLHDQNNLVDSSFKNLQPAPVPSLLSRQGNKFFDDVKPKVNVTHDVTHDSDVITASHVTTTPLIVDQVYLLTKKLSLCLRQNGHLEYFAYAFQIQLVLPPSDDVKANATMTCAITVSTASYMAFTIRLWKLPSIACSRRNYVLLRDEKSTATWYYTCKRQPDFYSSCGHHLKMKMHIGDHTYVQKFIIDAFSVVTKLQTLQLSSTTGYIQTPGYDQQENYPPILNVWETLSPPSDHVTFVSMRSLNVQGRDYRGECRDFMELYADGRTADDRVWKVCGISPAPPRVLRHATALHVHFVSDDFEERSGVRLVYSFHSHSQAPAQGPGGLWNCSVPEWSLWQLHFVCNLERECEGGQDEATCFYSGSCGQDYLTLDNRCYLYQESNRSRSWLEANMECVERGGYLASLNSPQEWQAVFRLLNSRRHAAAVFLGLKYPASSLPFYYRTIWQWADDSITYYLKASGTTGDKCGRYSSRQITTVSIEYKCSTRHHVHSLCEIDPVPEGDRRKSLGDSGIQLNRSTATNFSVGTVRCPQGHFTHTFSACDVDSACWLSRSGFSESLETWAVPTVSSCPAPLTSLPAMWACSRGGQRVPYSLVCDHEAQCGDGSDEQWCVHSPCSARAPFQCVTLSQCIPSGAFCNRHPDCLDNSDESWCDFKNEEYTSDTPMPPVIIHPDWTSATLRVHALSSATHSQSVCPDTHFLCTESVYCLPVYLRCNKVVDCPGREDEDGCEASICEGYYRCRGSMVCVHSSHVCDGVSQCPQKDDELMCGVRCPSSCTCHGLAFTCPRVFLASSVPGLRYLNAEGSSMTPQHLSHNALLIHLSLKNCGLKVLHHLHLVNLHSLDLSQNLITVLTVAQLNGVGNLQALIITDNPLISLFPSEFSQTQTLTKLNRLDLSQAALEEIDISLFAVLPNLLSINFSHSKLKKVFRTKPQPSTKLNVLDFRGCPLVNLQPGIISKLTELHSVFADDYKLCCPANLPPDFNVRKCVAPSDVVSSCGALLGSMVLRVSVGASCCAGVLGNLITFVLLLVRHRSSSCATGACLTHLKVSDLTLCVAVSMLAVADAVFDGRYVSEDTGWRHSVVCSIIHFLSVACSQASVVFVFMLVCQGAVCAIRAKQVFLFPPLSAHVVCVLLWLGCGAMSLGVTLLSATESPHASPLCFRLPVTATPPYTVRTETLHVLLVLNLLLLLLSTVGMVVVVVYVSTLHPSPLNLTPTPGDRLGEWRQVSVLCGVTVLGWALPCGQSLLYWRSSAPSMTSSSDTMTSWGLAGLVLAGPGMSAARPWLHVLGEREEGRRRERRRRLLLYCRSKAQCRAGQASAPRQAEGVPLQ